MKRPLTLLSFGTVGAAVVLALVLATLRVELLDLVGIEDFRGEFAIADPGAPLVVPRADDPEYLRQLAQAWRGRHPETTPGWCRLHGRRLEPACGRTVACGMGGCLPNGRAFPELTMFPNSRLIEEGGCLGGDWFQPTMACPRCAEAEAAWWQYVVAGGPPLGPDQSVLIHPSMFLSTPSS